MTGEAALLGLLDTVIDRAADILERIGDEVNVLSTEAFGQGDEDADGRDFKDVLRRLGKEGDLISKARESLVSMGRLLAFLGQTSEGRSRKSRTHLETLSHDIASLSDHATFLANKVNFLLEATLGLINVQPNNIIKIFSVAAVVVMPPTPIARIHGMNFPPLPEPAPPQRLSPRAVTHGGPSLCPYLFFRATGWLLCSVATN